MATPTANYVDELKINQLTQAQYNTITPSPTELYFVTDGTISYNDLVNTPTFKTINNEVITGSGDITTPTTFKGTYDSSVAYSLGDIVKYGNYFYIAKTATAGNAPNNTAYWGQISNTNLVDYSGISGNSEYPLGAVSNSASGNGYAGPMYFSSNVNKPTLNPSTGIISAPAGMITKTQAAGDNSTNVATTAFVTNAISNINVTAYTAAEVETIWNSVTPTT